MSAPTNRNCCLEVPVYGNTVVEDDLHSGDVPNRWENNELLDGTFRKLIWRKRPYSLSSVEAFVVPHVDGDRTVLEGPQSSGPRHRRILDLSAICIGTYA